MGVIRRTYHFILFLGFYFVKLVSANLYIAYDILTPRMRTSPGIIEVETRLDTEFGLLMLSNLVSMTPGTLSMDLDRDRGLLLVHVLYMDKQEEVEKEIRGIMRRIKQFSE